MASSPPPSSSSSSINIWNYDVFLSFRGTDTRNNFTSHLYQALHDKGIDVFIDNNLQRGEVITSQLLQVIETSRISIVVLSENYASSSFCLDEAVKILECTESKGQIVFPVFYRVNPTHVEELIGTFGDEFAKLEAQIITPKETIFSRSPGSNNHKKKRRSPRSSNKKKNRRSPGSMEEQSNDNEEATQNIDRVKKWRLALTEIARLSGWHLEEGTHESSTIKSIVKIVLKQLDHIPLHVAEYPVGLASRVESIIRELKLESGAVHMLGLIGMGGIGKTTTAKAIYNRCYNQFEFDGSSFLLNVRENSNKHGLAKLQETLLFEILGDNMQPIGNFDKGINLIKRKLHGKKVLIVIDDINHREQLNKLVGDSNWFGNGSIIIITTRDSDLVKHVTMVHEIKELENDEAIELFSWHAFKKPQPDKAYLKLSNCFLEYAQGLPLAIKVLGSLLYRRSTQQWEDILKKLKRYSNQEVDNILKLSYDDLDDEEKDIFLDIACFLNGQNKYVLIKFFDKCDFCGDLSVSRLIEKSLVCVDYGGIVQMHNLLQAMGTQIALQESSHSPPGRRLLIRDDIPPMISEDKSSYDVEGILVDFHGEEEKLLDELGKLQKLRILIIRGGSFIKIPESLPNSIRWLEWHDCPLNTIPLEFLPAKLVVLNVPNSRIIHFEKAFPVKVKKFTNLTRMYFNGCKFLRETVDFSAVLNVERLDLSHCRKLKMIDKSIASLKKTTIFVS